MQTLNKKIANVPVWGWLLITAGVVGFMWYRSRQSAGSQSNLNQVDPNNPMGLTYSQENADLASGIDPNTGQSFADERAAAGGTSLQGSGGGGTTDNTNPIQTITGEVGDLTALLTVLGKFETGLQSQFPKPGPPPKQKPQKITVGKGSAFYNWYLKTFGRPPPTTISSNNPVWKTWERVSASGKTGKPKNPGSGDAGKHLDALTPIGGLHPVRKHKHTPTGHGRLDHPKPRHVRGNRGGLTPSRGRH